MAQLLQNVRSFKIRIVNRIPRRIGGAPFRDVNRQSRSGGIFDNRKLAVRSIDDGMNIWRKIELFISILIKAAWAATQPVGVKADEINRQAVGLAISNQFFGPQWSGARRSADPVIRAHVPHRARSVPIKLEVGFY